MLAHVICHRVTLLASQPCFPESADSQQE